MLSTYPQALEPPSLVRGTRAAWRTRAARRQAPSSASSHTIGFPIAIAQSCQSLRQQAFPASVRVSLGDAPDVGLMRGGSAIINPLGKVLAGPHFDGATILTADLDLHDIGRSKFDFDVTGHYGRPDIFPLIVNE